MTIGFGPTIGNHETQEKVGFFEFKEFKKTRNKLDFHILMKIVKIEKRKKTWSFKDHENKPFLAQKHALRRQKLSGKKFCQSPVSRSRHDPDECNRATPESALK